MVAVTVRNLPDHVRDELAARAARSGRSLEEFLVHQLTALASRPALADVVAGARAKVHATGTAVSVQAILKARDADRR